MNKKGSQLGTPLTKEIADALRQANGTVSFVRVKDLVGNSHDYAFKRLSRLEIDLATKEIGNSPTRGLLIQMASTCVHGDENLLETDDEIFRAIQSKWGDLQKECEAEILVF
jgi:hypothetical protein